MGWENVYRGTNCMNLWIVLQEDPMTHLALYSKGNFDVPPNAPTNCLPSVSLSPFNSWSQKKSNSSKANTQFDRKEEISLHWVIRKSTVEYSVNTYSNCLIFTKVKLIEWQEMHLCSVPLIRRFTYCLSLSNWQVMNCFQRSCEHQHCDTSNLETSCCRQTFSTLLCQFVFSPVICSLLQ